jgi:hypothetical protein
MAATTIAQPIRYNEIPKESVLLTRIKPLERGQRQKYRVYGAYDPTKPGKFFGRTVALPTKDTIIDPDTQAVYDIAFVTGIGPGGVPEIGEIIFDDFNGCIISLTGGNATDQRKYQYIELCNFLKDNPTRDTNRTILIERVNEAEDLKYIRAKRKKVHAALSAVEALGETEVLNFIRANRMPDPGTPEMRRAALEDLAEKDPDKFNSMPTVDYTSLYDLIDEAKTKKIIVWNNITREWTRFSGEHILTVKKGFAVSQKEELAQFFMKEDGKKDREWIKKELQK